MTEQDKMREAFENAMRGSGLPLDRAGDGYYGVTDAAWIGYQAALSTQQDALERAYREGYDDGSMVQDSGKQTFCWNRSETKAALSPTNKDT